jgi:bifunctional non-homologous end joining protein LigD
MTTRTRPDGTPGEPSGPDEMPSWVEPQLATLTRERFSDPAWIFERKLDGERCLAYADQDGVRLMSRSRHEITTTFPEIAEAIAEQRHGDLVVDGEIVAFEGEQTRFGRLQQRLGVARPSSQLLAEYPVYYYVFDVLYADGRDTRPLPQRERKRVLAGLLPFRDPLRFTEHRERDGEALSAQACRDGWEGLIAKRADAPYQSGRTRNWLKFKCENSQEFVIGGYTDPQRSRVGFGALLLGYYEGGELVYAGKVGTGFGNATLLRLHDRLAGLERDDPPFTGGRLPPRHGVHWVEPRLVGEVGFSEWTSDGELRHPRFQGLRDDKEPREVVRELPS